MRSRVVFVVIGILLIYSPSLYSVEEASEGQPAQDSHGAEHHASDDEHHGVDGSALPLWMVIPFVGILLSIAIFPLVAEHFWHHHYGKVSLVWALIFGIPYLIAFKGNGFYDILHIYLLD
ncbi:TPA: sodium:proton antiporter, partial [Candidatus Poribacteria bacterium]|nr:sodium:proton antiporter [Candidatus Poribacteria bacterium]